MIARSCENQYEASWNVDDSIAHLLSGLVELTVGLEVKVDIDQVGTGQKLENHARGNDGGDTQLHQSTSVTGHHHSEPVQRVRGV